MARIEERRAELLARIPSWYSGWLHFGAINLSTLATIGLFGWLLKLEAIPPWQWALVPAFVVFANIFEWWVHRGPLHHRYPLLGILYERHARSHHVVFTDVRMDAESSREWALVLFPPYVLPLLLALTAPLAVGLWWLDPNLAWLFEASALAYYLVYEWLHLFHHLPADSWIGRRWIVQQLRGPHQRHHDPALMTQGNFNVSFPLADLILRSSLPSGLVGTSCDPADAISQSREGPPETMIGE